MSTGECVKCNEYRKGYAMPTYEGFITDESEFMLSFVCSYCLLDEINKQYSLSELLKGIKIK